MRVFHSIAYIGLMAILVFCLVFSCTDGSVSPGENDDSGNNQEDSPSSGDDLDWDETDDDASSGDDDAAGDDDFDDDTSDDDGPDVLILDDGISGEGLVDALDEFNISAQIWGLETLYKGENINAPVVVLFNGGVDVWEVDMPLEGQQGLLDHYQAGGGLVITEWVMWDNLNHGHYSLLSKILPVSTDGEWGAGLETFFVERPNHAITQNLPPDFVFQNIAYSHLSAFRGEIVIRGYNSGDAIVADATGPGRLVYGAFAGASDGLSGKVEVWTDPMKLLFRNIVTWLTE